MGLVNRPTQIMGFESGFLGMMRNYNVAKSVNGGLDFGSSIQTAQGPGSAYTGNMNGQWINVTAPSTPNTTFSVAHNLNRIPSHYIWTADRAAHLSGLPGTYGTWTATTAYFQSDTASAVYRIFLM